MTQRLPRGGRGGGNSISMGARKMSLCYFTKETRCQETIILGQFLLHPTRFLSKLDVPMLRVVGEPPPSPARRRIGDSTPSPSPRFYYRIFVTAITMPSRARGRENNRDASRTGRRVDIEFIRLRESLIGPVGYRLFRCPIRQIFYLMAILLLMG